MQIDAKGKYGKELHLGVQTNVGETLKKVMVLSQHWAPKKAKSFTITSMMHTDYHGNEQLKETGYATFTVAYYSTKKEGKNILTSH